MTKSQPHLLRLYLDVSCLNRPFDDQRQPRVRLESEAVLYIFGRINRGIWLHVSSEMALVEIDAIRQSERRKRILSMLPSPENIMPIGEHEEEQNP